MVRQIPEYLKLVNVGGQVEPPAENAEFKHLAEVCRTFEQATGWPLELTTDPPSKTGGLWTAPVDLGVGRPSGHLRIVAADRVVEDRGARASLKRAGGLAAAVAELWRELIATRRTLAKREAELATGVPVTVRRADSGRLAARLEAILKAGAESLGCQAAAMYLLDDATTELKVRACWGLPGDRMLCAARPLTGALADLEALLGHAVVLSDDSLHHYWKPPESFAAAACVPISTASNPLGTLWVFSSQPRDFTDAETNLMEVLAGSVAAELEREVLADETLAARSETRTSKATGLNASRLCPSAPPVFERWDVAGRTCQRGALGGAICDWFARPDGALGVVLGCASESGLTGAFTAHAVRAAVRAQAHAPEPDQCVLHTINSVLWTTSAGDQCASLFHARLHDATKTISLSASGLVRVLLLRSKGTKPISCPRRPLGMAEAFSTEPADANHEVRLERGDVLVVYTQGNSATSSAASPGDDETLAEVLRHSHNRSAEHLADLAAKMIAEGPHARADHAVLVIRRR